MAFVGRSGSGKTTLVKLLAGLIEPTEGTIFFDGVDLQTLNFRDLRRHIGMVLQENHMFDDTITRNISFGDPEPDFDRVLAARRRPLRTTSSCVCRSVMNRGSANRVFRFPAGRSSASRLRVRFTTIHRC